MNPTPSGTVTFLFTDIEGSTRLWAEHPNEMQMVQPRHDELIRRAVEAHAGYVFKTVGDQTCAAFADANDALTAAVSAQQALLASEWPAAVGPLRVRMGLHTGSVELRGGDYFGFTLSQIARIHSAAHGGQIVVSRPTAELLKDRLAAEIALRDIGSHRLKDLTRPEQIFQVQAPGLPVEFPPLKTLDSVPNNLPTQTTPLVGRGAEIAEARRLLESTRLLTMTGPGGTGKTRLALQVAAESLESFPDGVFFVALAQVNDAENLPGAIAKALAVNERPCEEVLTTICRHLKELNRLLVLDNFEQIMSAATVVSELLVHAPRLKVIATSREPLHLHGEQEYSVPALVLPDLGRRESTEALSQYEAVELFIQRGRAVNPRFEVTNANAPAVAEVCVRLDGLPLAIELAASRMKLFTPKQLLDRLGRHLPLLSTKSRDSPERHQTLQNTIDWSYNLLEEQERLLFTRLSVFSGGFTVEAAEEICGADDPSECTFDVVGGIESLLDKSLLRRSDCCGADDPRFRMLQTIRRYALERLEAEPNAREIRTAHADYFARVADDFHELMWFSNATMQEADAWMHRIADDYDNILAALEWSTSGGRIESAFRIVGNLLPFYWSQGKLREAKLWTGRLLTGAGEVGPHLLGPVYRLAGMAANAAGDESTGAEFFAHALEVARESGDERGEGFALLMSVSTMTADPKRHDEAEKRIRKAIELFGRSARSASLIGWAHNDLGELYRAQKRYKEAVSAYEEALALVPNGDISSLALANLSIVQNRVGDRAAAMRTARNVLEHQIRGVLSPTIVVSLFLSMAAAVEDSGKAVRLLSASDAITTTVGHVREYPDQIEFDLILADLKSRVSPEQFERFWREGATMSIEDATAYALTEADKPTDHPAGRQ